MRYFKMLAVRAKRVQVAEGEENYQPKVIEPGDIAELARRIHQEDREVFMVFPLDIRNKPLGFYVAGMGGVDTCPVDPREVFRMAVMLAASSVIVVHNHPSGEADPSSEDKNLTKRLISAGKLLGIPILDHVVVSETDHQSLRESLPGLWS